MTRDIRIVGGADPEVAAAIAAVIDQVMRDELVRDTGTVDRPTRSRWAMSEHIKPAPVVVRTPRTADGQPPTPV